jgi:hypothetical protein
VRDVYHRGNRAVNNEQPAHSTESGVGPEAGPGPCDGAVGMEGFTFASHTDVDWSDL